MLTRCSESAACPQLANGLPVEACPVMHTNMTRSSCSACVPGYRAQIQAKEVARAQSVQQLRRSQRLVRDLKRGSVSMAQLQAMPETSFATSSMPDARLDEAEETHSMDQVREKGLVLLTGPSLSQRRASWGGGAFRECQTTALTAYEDQVENDHELFMAHLLSMHACMQAYALVSATEHATAPGATEATPCSAPNWASKM